MKKLFALCLSLVLALGLATSALADEPTSGTITVTNATAGQTYTAYKLFDATYDGTAVSYKVPAAKKDSLSTDLFDISSVADTDGNYTFSKKSAASDADVLSWIKENYSTFAGSPISGVYNSDKSTVTFSDLAFGYYYITSSLGTTVTIDSAVPNADVLDKNDSTPNGPDKEITAENSATITPAEANDAGVGSTESFEVTFNAVNYKNNGESEATKVTVYNFTDTPTGLDIDKSTVKVYVNDTLVTIPADNITKSEAGVLSITIPWVNDAGDFLYEAKTSGSALIPVKITYDATITAAAATATAPNTVDVKYNNDQDIGTDTATTYTYKFKLDKSKADYTELLGAKFQIYAGSSIGDSDRPLKFTMNGGKYQLDPNGSVDTIDLTTVASAEIIGLDKADYTLRETVVPAGYNQAPDQTVTAATLKRVDQGIIDAENAVEGDEGVVTVVNNQGAELPSTGGIGTTIFYIVGGILVLGAGVLLITKKRMTKEG
ncbi:MAG: LPXTG cell wall anchor domain-containing protein [Oscillibacter sp.]|nr:LPXTG cell wall anchor domain-containing protein [Oscillibacter sp.]